MHTNEYYSKWRFRISMMVTVITYLVVFSVFTLVTGQRISAVEGKEFEPNYDKSFNEVVHLADASESVECDPGYSLSEIKHNPETMYLNWSVTETQAVTEPTEVEEVIPNTGEYLVEYTMDLPDVQDTSFKGYMCMHMITAEDSKQWEFLRSGDFELYSDDNGFMKYKDYYIVALANYYADYKIGATFRVTLSSGRVFDVITGDVKSDVHTDSNRMYKPKGEGRGEIVEFIIACGAEGKCCNNYTTMSDYNRALGNLSSIGFQGNVVKIEKLDDYSVTDILYG